MRTFVYFAVLLLVPFLNRAQDMLCNDMWHYGEGTFYGGVAGGQGNCGLDVPLGDTMHVAMNHVDYDSSNACGACLRVIGPKAEVFLHVADRCPECRPGDLDMTPQAFFALAQERDGRIPLSWQYVPCPAAQGISIKFKIGSSAFWSAVQVRNSRYAVAKFEFRHADGRYEEMPRTMYNFFLKESGIDDLKTNSPGPYHFRITAVNGQVVELPAVPFDTVQEYVSGQQFALLRCPDCHGDTLGGAAVDNCGICSGGKTGIVPNSACSQDCNGYWDGTAYTDGCGRCVAGTTGATPCDADCYGTAGGSAYIDKCGRCVGGFTGAAACKKDCANIWGGSDFPDACGHCSGGTTGIPVCIAQHIMLSAGWNLFSINIDPYDLSIESVFRRLDILEIKSMDAFWRKDQPEFLNTLTAIVPGNGYLVKMYTGGELTLAGTRTVPRPYNEKQGWQLAGCPYQAPQPVAKVLGSNSVELKDFSGFWMPSNVQNSITDFEPGKGYFIRNK